MIRVINEPTAAALAYGYIEDLDRRIAVFDFGGGTFDLTILQITHNVFEVLATSGEMFLGGDDIDEVLVHQMVAAYREKYGNDLWRNPKALEILRTEAEALKIHLSSSEAAISEMGEVVAGSGKAFDFRLSQAELRQLVEPIIRRTTPVCHDALQVAGLQASQIDEIVLVGGTTRMPLVREVVREIFGKDPQTSINPMSVVAVGAAIQGAALLGTLVPMAEGGVATPSAGGLQSAVLLDVTPRSLGIGTVGGNVDFVIGRNVVIPVERTQLFTTARDGQSFVRIQICQGESSIFDENVKLGEVILSDIRPAPRGEAVIAVTFEINTDGILEVRAEDRKTGEKQVAKLRVLGALPPEELDAIMERSRRMRGPFADGGEVTRR